MPFFSVFQGCIQRSLRNPYREGADTDPAAVEHGQELLEPFAPFAKQVFRRNTHVLERNLGRIRCPQTQFLVGRGNPVAWRIGGDDEGADPPRSLAGFRHCGNHSHTGLAGVGDKAFATVDHPLLPFKHGGSASASGIRTRFGLGETEGSEHLTAGAGRHPPALLLPGAKKIDRACSNGAVSGVGNPRGGTGAGDLFHSDSVGKVAVSRASVIFTEGECK